MRSSPGQPLAPWEKSLRPYSVIAVSVYCDQLVMIDAIVDELRARGFTKASRSLVLRSCVLALPLAAVERLVTEQMGKDAIYK